MWVRANTNTADSIRKRETYHTHGIVPACEECGDVRYIVYIIQQRENEKWDVFEVDRRKMREIGIRDMGRVNHNGERTIPTNTETTTQ